MLAYVSLALPLLGLAALWRWRRRPWMGLADKTLWDWMTLLAVPAMVAAGTAGFAFMQYRTEQAQIAEAALSAYVDRISTLVTDPAMEGRPDLARAVGRAQTLAVLGVLEGARAGRVLVFLDQLDLLGDFAPSLEGRNLAGAELKGLNLEGIDLEGAVLRGADLEGVRLSGADLEEVDLRGADLKGADLTGAELDGARLDGADLGAADLRGANLRTSEGLVQAQVDRACSDATTRLPAGLRASEVACGASVEEMAD